MMDFQPRRSWATSFFFPRLKLSRIFLRRSRIVRWSQVAGGCDRQRDPGNELTDLRLRDDLGLHPGRGEEQVFSARESSETATTRSMSRVVLGSARAETAKPPTSAQR